jgi:heme-degrading monooxygenase HmoA
MIARVWRGDTRTEDAEAYAALLGARGLSDCRRTQGNLGALLLRHPSEETTEFVLISFWQDLEAIRRFAGPDPAKAVYLPEEEPFLLGREPRVTLYELDAAALPAESLGSAEVPRRL